MTAESNVFQSNPDATPAEQQALALQEFEALAMMLRAAGIKVIVVDDTEEPHTPDSIFPNNWVSFHADGRVVLYPMEAENRRSERRADIIEMLGSDFQVSEILDLSAYENSGRYLEGTGSMVLDRTHRIAYACLSSRTQLDPLGEFSQRMDYDLVTFEAVDRNGVAIYHTNVLMNVGKTIAVICSRAITRDDQRDAVLASLNASHHQIVDLDYDQLDAFAGNMLELQSRCGDRIIAMSTQAWRSLYEHQCELLSRNVEIVHSPIDNIEMSAGGSVRCMLAEIHLPT